MVLILLDGGDRSKVDLCFSLVIFRVQTLGWKTRFRRPNLRRYTDEFYHEADSLRYQF
jgi:hypothetical protein